MLQYLKLISILCLILFSLSACTKFIAETDLEDEWEIIENENIVLHFRNPGFSNTISPTREEASQILENQTLYYSCIQDSIGKTYTSKVVIYLFNQDEAEKHIGTSYGGHSIPKLNTIYFSFFHQKREYTDKYGIDNMFLGAHELVHVISHRTLGYAGTTLMSEGYANWLDGSYARYHIRDLIRNYRDNAPNKIMTPDQLLTNTKIDESVYYPNVGIFIQFMVEEFGIIKVNELFTSTTDSFKNDVEKIFQLSWKKMKERYLTYIQTI